jgi:HPr kinase/phosphorylase
MADRGVKTQIHASCAARDGAGVLLLGPSGCGKSDLLLRLIDRGFTLVADDRVDIEAGIASPASGLEGLVEMRGLGILRFAYLARARLALACEMTEHPPRLPEPAWHPLGLPVLRLDARAASAPLLVAHALDCAEGRTSMLAGAFVRSGA